MKKRLFILILFVAAAFAVYSQTNSGGKCTITCNLTTAYVCPNSATWKSNPEMYNDAELMTSLDYVKDNKGCWQLKGGTTKTITGTPGKLKTWFAKLKKSFSTTKSGF